MRVGVTLPILIPGTSGELILEWTRRADAGPFSSLGVGDRVAYPGYDPMISLAAAAAVTSRIRLLVNVLVLPLYNASVVAKQAATIDAQSGGRLTLGVGIGGREDDYRAALAPWKGRARRFEEQLALMKRIWANEPPFPGVPPVGPTPVRPGGPELLIGAIAPVALYRVARWADGLASFDFVPDAATVRPYYDVVEEAWKAEGRVGRPRFVASFFYALGPNAGERLGSYIGEYLGYMGREIVEGLAASVSTTSPEAVKGAIRAFADIGTDEVVLVPCTADLDQLDRLADLVG
jgi:alkanesulfonate monooxygenase SsuD/methylene tetrahydromethanopterin reductase-like flavin-dependent oxidoreductase (luciferase family)